MKGGVDMAGVCPFSNPPSVCRNDCALALNGECSFLVIAKNSKPTKSKEQK